MSLSTKHKVAIGLVAMAAGAIVVDRFVIGYAADPLVLDESDLLAASSSVKGQVAARTGQGEALSLADRINAFASSVRELDQVHAEAMVVPAAWTPVHSRPEIRSENGSEAPVASPPSLRLTLVVRDASGVPTAAVINGERVRPGDAIAGCTLLRIEQGIGLGTRAIFSWLGGELAVPMESGQGRPIVVFASPDSRS